MEGRGEPEGSPRSQEEGGRRFFRKTGIRSREFPSRKGVGKHGFQHRFAGERKPKARVAHASIVT
jgi:hypothetical protein